MARSLEIPAVVEAGSAREPADGVTLIVDGRTGRVIVDPDAGTIAEYASAADMKALPGCLRRSPAETKDGVRLLANVDQLEEMRDALRYGAEGISDGTEFLFLNRHDRPRGGAARRLRAHPPPCAVLGDDSHPGHRRREGADGPENRTKPTRLASAACACRITGRTCWHAAWRSARARTEAEDPLPMVSSPAESSTRGRFETPSANCARAGVRP
jgi:hypothetical protein